MLAQLAVKLTDKSNSTGPVLILQSLIKLALFDILIFMFAGWHPVT